MNDVYLFLLAEGLAGPDGQWPVLVRAADGQTHRCELAELPSQLRAAGVVLVLPMEMAGYCRIGPVPGRRPSRETLEYAAEEQMAAPLEVSHLAFGPADEQGRRKALIVGQEALRRVLETLLAQGIDPVAVHVDADLLGIEQTCALWFEGRWLLGGVEGPRLAVSDQAAQVLMHKCVGMPWVAQAGSSAATACDRQVVSALELLLQGRAGAVDLRQGAMRRPGRGPVWNGLAAGVLLSLLMVCMADYLRTEWLLQRASREHAENAQALQRWAPEQPVGTDLNTLIRSLEPRPQPTTAIEKLGGFAEQLVGTANIVIERAESSPAQGWRVDVVAQGFGDLERLAERVAGMRMEHGRQADGGVRATLSWQESE